MKLKQYSNGNRFIVFDTSDPILLKERVHNILTASNKVESVKYNSPNSIKLVFSGDARLNKESARTTLDSILLPIVSKQARINDIDILEAQNPILKMFIEELHGSRYKGFLESEKELVIALYHFFLYDFVCNFKNSDMLWCLPFFEIGAFDRYGNFHAEKLLIEFENFKKNTVASNE